MNHFDDWVAASAYEACRSVEASKRENADQQTEATLAQQFAQLTAFLPLAILKVIVQPVHDCLLTPGVLAVRDVDLDGDRLVLLQILRPLFNPVGYLWIEGTFLKRGRIHLVEDVPDGRHPYLYWSLIQLVACARPSALLH